MRSEKEEDDRQDRLSTVDEWMRRHVVDAGANCMVPEADLLASYRDFCDRAGIQAVRRASDKEVLTSLSGAGYTASGNMTTPTRSRCLLVSEHPPQADAGEQVDPLHALGQQQRHGALLPLGGTELWAVLDRKVVRLDTPDGLPQDMDERELALALALARLAVTRLERRSGS